MALRFHWMLPKGGEVTDEPQTAQYATSYRLQETRVYSPIQLPDMKGWSRFAEQAEEYGIDSVLISFSRYEPDPFVVSCALGMATKKLKFIAAYRLGLMQPAVFVQQVNTVSALIGGRISLNIVAGSSTAEQRGYGDYLLHDERYARAEEFMAVCNSFWNSEAGADFESAGIDFEGKYYRVEKGKVHTPFLAPGRRSPEIYISGHSEAAEHLARVQGACLLRVADSPSKLRTSVARLRQRGVEVCLRLHILCRRTREEAIEVAESLLPERHDAVREKTAAVQDDSRMYREAATPTQNHWLTRSLWSGLTPYYGPVWTTLLGTPQEVAEGLLEFKAIGVTQFIISGWPEHHEVKIFGREVLPLVREAEENISEARI
jgi:alkanesulfonate monooxygenase